MADVVGSAPRIERHETARLRRRRDDVWVALTALAAAMLALPLAQSSWHGPEAAAVLAVAATSMLAGQRWAIAVVVIAELVLVPTVCPRAFASTGELAPHLAAIGSLVMIVPGILAMRRAAAALVLITGLQRSSRLVRRLHAAMVFAGAVVTVVSLL
jgi:hypothetical protein